MEIKNYKLKQIIGKGGMATVYLGEHTSLKRSAALKIMSADIAANEQFQKSFLKEGEIVAQLEHPNIVGIYDIGRVEDDSTFFMAMEYLRGGSLKDKLETIEDPNKALPYQECVDILTQVGAGLEYAHQQDFVHRDIKPANILFRQDGTAVLTDFGIAKLQDSVGDLTRLGYTLGTVQYMSPEQASTTELDQRSDIYSLGLVFYEMLTGHKAHQAETTAQAIYQHVNEAPPPLEPHYAYLQTVMDKVLAKEPDKRFSSVSDFITALKNADPNADLNDNPNDDKTVVYKANATRTTADDDSSKLSSHHQPIKSLKNAAFAKKPLLISAAIGAIIVLAFAFFIPSFGTPDSTIADNNTTLNTFDPLSNNQLHDTNTALTNLSNNVDTMPSSETEKVNMILDASGSMWAKINGVEKINIAREVIKKTVDNWDTNKALGLMVYGHRSKGDCDDIEQLLPIDIVDKTQFYQAIDNIRPKGKTPIAQSLKIAANELKYTEDKASIILISDGEESCAQDPCQMAKELASLGVDFKAHVIGFDIKNQEAKQQLQCIADSTGGDYQEANSQQQLDQALEKISKAVTEDNVDNSPDTNNTTEPEKPETGLLKLRAVSKTSGQPIKADFIVKRIDQTTLRRQQQLHTLWTKTLLDFLIPTALAREKIVIMRAGQNQVRVKNAYKASFELPVGQYRVIVRHKDFEVRKNITIIANKTQSSQFRLKPIDIYANIELKSLNANNGEALKVRYSVTDLNSGNKVATHNLVKFKLKQGQYEVKAIYHHNDMKPMEQTQTINITQPDTLQLVFKFQIKDEPKPEPEPEPIKGKLKVKAVDKETGQALKVKFTLIRSSDAKVIAVYQATQSAQLDLVAGKYQIYAEYQSGKIEKLIDLYAGKTQDVVFEIPPEKTVLKQGILRLTASDAVTKKPIKIDFSILDQAGKQIEEQKNTHTAEFTLAIEKYTVIAHHPAHKKDNDQSKIVEIKADETTEQNFLIKPISIPPKQPVEDATTALTKVIITVLNAKTQQAEKVHIQIKDQQKKIIARKFKTSLAHINLAPNQYEITIISPKQQWKPITKTIIVKAQKVQTLVFFIPLKNIPTTGSEDETTIEKNPSEETSAINTSTAVNITPDGEVATEKNPSEKIPPIETGEKLDNSLNSAATSDIESEKLNLSKPLLQALPLATEPAEQAK